MDLVCIGKAAADNERQSAIRQRMREHTVALMDELLHRMAAYNACLPSAFQRQCFNNQNPATNEVTAGLSETSPRNHKYTSRGQACSLGSLMLPLIIIVVSTTNPRITSLEACGRDSVIEKVRLQ
eukprot:535794-Pelagomonas_calceolata.AAC.1